MTELIKHFRQVSDVIEYNIFNSVHNINLRTVIGYHKDDQEYNFLDDYDDDFSDDEDAEERSYVNIDTPAADDAADKKESVARDALVIPSIT